MRILLEHGYSQNDGDLAMLLVAVERIRGLCPAAAIRLATAQPELLALSLVPRLRPFRAKSVRPGWRGAPCWGNIVSVFPGRFPAGRGAGNTSSGLPCRTSAPRAQN